MITEIKNITNGKSLCFYEDENDFENSDMDRCNALTGWLDFFEGNKNWSETINLDREGVIIDNHYMDTAISEKRAGGTSRYSIHYTQKTLMKVIKAINNFSWFLMENSYDQDHTGFSGLMNEFQLELEKISEEKLT